VTIGGARRKSKEANKQTGEGEGGRIEARDKMKRLQLVLFVQIQKSIPVVISIRKFLQ
jgi:hypothetical protein